MSDKRPETAADILSRAQAVWGTNVGDAPRQRGRRYNVDLPSHMAECDANYHRVMRLFPGLRDAEAQTISLLLPSLKASVVFEVLERGPYTTLVEIKLHHSEQWMEMTGAFECRMRVYHDAQSAEVVSYQNHNRFHGKYDYPNRGMRQRDEKVQLNRFVGEFLTLCLAHGASTDPVAFQR